MLGTLKLLKTNSWLVSSVCSLFQLFEVEKEAYYFQVKHPYDQQHGYGGYEQFPTHEGSFALATFKKINNV